MNNEVNTEQGVNENNDAPEETVEETTVENADLVTEAIGTTTEPEETPAPEDVAINEDGGEVLMEDVDQSKGLTIIIHEAMSNPVTVWMNGRETAWFQIGKRYDNIHPDQLDALRATDAKVEVL